jgi:23S rRNA (pseudouridine1915-N3)-methyltransferase
VVADRDRLRAEGEAMLTAIPKGAWSVALDRRGTQRSSAELASWLQRLLDDWSGPIAFLVGSDLGLDSALLTQVRDQLSFGPLTLPHEMARVVLYEQIYRGLCIGAGIKYHREPL